jgi:hypothetical protein
MRIAGDKAPIIKPHLDIVSGVNADHPAQLPPAGQPDRAPAFQHICIFRTTRTAQYNSRARFSGMRLLNALCLRFRFSGMLMLPRLRLRLLVLKLMLWRSRRRFPQTI